MHDLNSATPAIFSSEDYKHMSLALEKAVQALDSGDYPIGAALVIDGDFVDAESNSNLSNWTWTSHAEHKLMLKHSARLRKAVQAERATIELFSTIEPCLMCLGTAVFNRIRRIVYAMQDPIAGAAQLDPQQLGDWYSRRWPLMQVGLLREQSESIFRRFKSPYPRTDD